MYILKDWVVLNLYGFVACKHDAIQCRCLPSFGNLKDISFNCSADAHDFVITLSDNLDALANCFGISVV